MSEINNEEKQSINNIKSLYKMNAEGVIPSLFHEVKKAKQQTFNLLSNYKDKIASIKQEQENKLKLEFLKEQAKLREANFAANKEEESSVSFAELFESKEKKSKAKTADVEPTSIPAKTEDKKESEVKTVEPKPVDEVQPDKPAVSEKTSVQPQ